MTNSNINVPNTPLPPCAPPVPWLSVLADQADEGLHLSLGDVLLQQFAVVVQQGGDGVLGQDVVTDLTLHHSELLGDVLLEVRDMGRMVGILHFFLFHLLSYLDLLAPSKRVLTFKSLRYSNSPHTLTPFDLFVFSLQL